jgi:hypothetical protein
MSLRGVSLIFAMVSSMAQAQAAPAPTVFRQSLDDAWWTGPMLASNATTLPRGHLLLEPYLYDVITEGFYNANGTRVSAPHENGFGSLTYINYGLFNKLTVGVISVFGYNEVSSGPSSAALASAISRCRLSIGCICSMKAVGFLRRPSMCRKRSPRENMTA